MAETDMRVFEGNESLITLPNGDTIRINNSLLRVIASTATTYYEVDEPNEDYAERCRQFYEACKNGDFDKDGEMVYG